MSLCKVLTPSRVMWVCNCCDMVSCFRIVERGYYSERDAAHVIKQILEAVAVRLLLPALHPDGGSISSRQSAHNAIESINLQD